MSPTLTTLRTAGSGAPRGVGPAGLREPTRSLLRHRLIDLERRLVDMAETITTRLCGGAAAAGPAAPRPDAVVLGEVRAALARFETGRYGHCVECGAPIEPARLIERPQAGRCEDCEHEHAQHAGRAVCS
ncbi:MAG: TraR/DksA C4-type zinc finger protein [Methylibium sp.]|nr:TraR/DksA C4-type zinc finger protein [Methylibium sp.]